MSKIPKIQKCLFIPRVVATKTGSYLKIHELDDASKLELSASQYLLKYKTDHVISQNLLLGKFNIASKIK